MSEWQLAPLLALLIARIAGGALLRISYRGEATFKLSSMPYLSVLLVHALLAWLALWLTLGWTPHALGYGLMVGTGYTLGQMVIGADAQSESSLGWLESTLELTLLLVVWLAVTGQWWLPGLAATAFRDEQVLLLVLAYIVVIWPVSSLIGWVCRPWVDVAKDLSALPRAGAWIGMLERVLVLTFILMDEVAAIGFLLAAKSILRFGGTQETDHRKLTEYVLIGTLASFTVTILIGLLVRWLLLEL